jgi:hypothetical protein
VDNPADHAPIIDPRLAPRVSGKVRRNLRKLGVCQPKTVGNHWRFLSEAVNHDAALKPTTLWVRALDCGHSTYEACTVYGRTIIGVLKEHEAGAKTADLARKHGVSERRYTIGSRSTAAWTSSRPSARRLG